MPRPFDYPPIWLAAFAALAWGQGRLWPLHLGQGAELLGRGLIGVGLVLTAAAVIQFYRHKTTVIPGHDPSALITRGIFAYSRNPIYLADLLFLTGLSLLWGAPLGLLMVPIFAALLQNRFIIPEEARLRAHFGAAFEAYTARTRRWL